jgi:hypothetical protein
MGKSATKQQDSAITTVKTVTDSSALDSASTRLISKKPFRFIDDEPDTVPNQVVEVQDTTFQLQGPGLFKNHSLKVKNENAKPTNDFVSDWFTLSLFIIVLVFTWFRFFYYKMFKQLLSSYFNITATNQVVRDESVLLQRASLIISIISYLLGGLFLYQLSLFYDWDISWLQKGIVRFALFSVVIAIAYSLKMIALRFLSIVFGQERPAAMYIFNVFLMIMFAGLVLLPANMLIAYAPSELRALIFQVSIGILGLLFLYRLVRAIGIWIGIPGFSFLYLFLYLCAFEIAPLLIIWKIADL